MPTKDPTSYTPSTHRGTTGEGTTESKLTQPNQGMTSKPVRAQSGSARKSGEVEHFRSGGTEPQRGNLTSSWGTWPVSRGSKDDKDVKG